jgi:hypothetical protein
MQHFKGRKLVIATKHGKEKVIAPQLEEALGVETMVSEGLDTDLLGTFTGEVERTLDPLSAARTKCQLAMDMHRLDLAVATEGSFVPHPNFPWASMHHEIIFLVDAAHDVEFWVDLSTLHTPFKRKTIATILELDEFCAKVGFPGQRVILSSKSGIRKGLASREDLLDAAEELGLRSYPIVVETDMRAMCSPTRMTWIGKVTEQLVNHLRNHCPECYFPGLQLNEIERGLPCSGCGLPTQTPISYGYNCRKCTYTTRFRYPEHKTMEDPGLCQICNP